MKFSSLTTAIDVTRDRLRTAPLIRTGTWQGVSTHDRPEMATREITNVFFTTPVPHSLVELAGECRPNKVWADEHFEERVSGKPLNPPPSWERWPYASSAKHALTKGVFSHTYPERMWPKNANTFADYDLEAGVHKQGENRGIRYTYGDLADVVNLLEKDPFTRQAYLPIFFPEDTGAVHGERVPCTLGYYFLMRNGQLNLFYPIRSCDFTRHFRDDIYLAIRLLYWVLEKLAERDAMWDHVSPGTFSVWVGSLHIFVNDYIKEFGGVPPRAR